MNGINIQYLSSYIGLGGGVMIEGKGRESMITQRQFAEAMYIKIIGSDY